MDSNNQDILRGLAIGDRRTLDAVMSVASEGELGTVDRTTRLVQLAATIALDSDRNSIAAAIESCLSAGFDPDIVTAVIDRLTRDWGIAGAITALRAREKLKTSS